MLTDLILKELEDNFDTIRFDFHIIFDGTNHKYGTPVLSFVKEVIMDAQENALGSKHATIYIRDNTQSYVYDYDVEKDTLIRRDEESLYQPLLKEEEQLDKERQKSEKLKKELYKELIITFLVGSIPFAMGIFGFLLFKSETTASGILSVVTLCELILIIFLVFRFATLRLHPYMVSYSEDSEDSKGTEDMDFKANERGNLYERNISF